MSLCSEDKFFRVKVQHPYLVMRKTATTLIMFVTTRMTDGIAPANASGSTDVGSYVHGGQEPAHSMMHIQHSKSHVCTYIQYMPKTMYTFPRMPAECILQLYAEVVTGGRGSHYGCLLISARTSMIEKTFIQTTS